MTRTQLSSILPYNPFLNLYAKNLDLWIETSQKMFSGLGRSATRNARTVEDGAEQIVHRATRSVAAKTVKPRRKAAGTRKKSASKKKR